MNKVLDLINPNDIDNVENIIMPINISTSRSIYKLQIKNTFIFYSNPVLNIKLHTDDNIELNKILKCVELTIGGEVIDKLTQDEINTYQYQYYLEPYKLANIIVFPIPINCLNNKNAMFISEKTYHEHWIHINFEMDVNKIASCSLFINNVILNKNADLSNLTNYYYRNMITSNIHCSKNYSDCFIGYCENKIKLFDNDSDAVKIYKPENKSLLFGVKVSQKCNNYIIKKNCVEINQLLYFTHDVKNIYFQLNQIKTGKIYEEKWFDYISITVNNNEFINYSYAIITNQSKGLQNGIFLLTGFEYINFNKSDVMLNIYGVKLNSSNNNNYELSCYCETVNYFISGQISCMLFTE